MAREWQQTKDKGYVLPSNVYMQALWAVRDYSRLKKLYDMGSFRGEMGSEDGFDSWKKEMHCFYIEERIRAIEEALGLIPSEYRRDIMDNIILHKAYGDYAHENTWKRWKQRFIYYVAYNLGLNL